MQKFIQVIRRKFRKFLKNSSVVFNLSTWFIYVYLRLSYITTRWRVVYLNGSSAEDFLSEKKVIFALWHNRLAFSFKIFAHQKNISALASTHSDGKIITKIIRLWGFKVIEGSTNKNSIGAVKEIIRKLKNDEKIVITPDGPRGPKYKINSSMTNIASKFGAKIIPVSCEASNYFALGSWDQMIIPKPFSRVIIIVGNSIVLGSDDKKNKELLENTLNDLAIQAKLALIRGVT
jgi:hypothetical protein